MLNKIENLISRKTRFYKEALAEVYTPPKGIAEWIILFIVVFGMLGLYYTAKFFIG